MVFTISVNVNEKTVYGIVEHVRSIPNLTQKSIDRWGKYLENMERAAARQAGIKDFSGDLYGRKGISWRPDKNGGQLFVIQHGVFLDSMRPHYVVVKKSRKNLLEWASARGFEPAASMVKQGKLKGFPIYVKPHPFMRKGFIRAYPRLKMYMQEELKKSRYGAFGQGSMASNIREGYIKQKYGG